MTGGDALGHEELYRDRVLARVIANYVHTGLCERYPLYVLDFVMWPHRANKDRRPDGPGGSGRILVNWEGLVLGQRGEPAPGLKGVFDHPGQLFESTYLDSERSILEMRRTEWSQRSPRWHKDSPHEFGSMFCYGVESLDGAEDAKAQPDPDTWYARSTRINVVDVQAVAIRAAAVQTRVSKTVLLMPFPTESEAILIDAARMTESPAIVELVREAITVYDSSRRCSSVVLRTVAEDVAKDLAGLLGAKWKSLDKAIDSLEQWLNDQYDASVTDPARKRMRRELFGSVGRVVQALNRLRELGNSVHEPSPGASEIDEIVCATELLRGYVEARQKLGTPHAYS
jgi:hypothetical protein